MAHDEQSTEELAAHFGSDGPVQAAEAWRRAMFDDEDFDAAWELMSESLRRRLIDAWVRANLANPWMQRFDLNTLTDTLHADKEPALGWRAFVQTQEREFDETIEGADGGWGTASRPRVLAHGLELVLMVNPDDVAPSTLVQAPTEDGIQIRAQHYVMQHGPSGWLLLDFDPERALQP